MFKGNSISDIPTIVIETNADNKNFPFHRITGLVDFKAFFVKRTPVINNDPSRKTKKNVEIRLGW